MRQHWLQPGNIDEAFESATMALRLAMRDEALTELSAIALNTEEDDARRKMALGTLCRLGYGELECSVLVDVLQNNDEDESLRVWAAGCLCFIVSQSRLAQRSSDESGFPGLNALTQVAHDRAAPQQLRAAALQGLVCSWRDEDFSQALALIGDPQEDAVFRGIALSQLPQYMSNPLPSWLCHFSAVQQVRDMLFLDGSGDEDTRRRWDQICALVVEQILTESDEVTELTGCAIAALKQIPRAPQRLYEIALDEVTDMRLRNNAVNCLLGMSTNSAISSLMGVIVDVLNDQLRKYATRGLTQIDEAQTLNSLVAVLKDNDSPLERREHAAVAMLMLGKQAGEKIMEIAKENEHSVVTAAIGYGAQQWAAYRKGQSWIRTSPEVVVARAIMYGDVDKYDKRIEAMCDAALDAEADNASLYAIRSYQRAQNEDWDGAMDDIEAALKLAPEDEYSLNFAAYIELRRGQYDAAIERLRKCIAVNGTTADIENSLGCALFQMRHFEEALSHYRNSVELDPDTLTRNYYVLCALLILGREDEARELVASAESYRDELNALQTAELEVLQGELDACLTHLTNAVNEGVCNRLDLDDPSFDRVRNDSRFRELLTRFE